MLSTSDQVVSSDVEGSVTVVKDSSVHAPENNLYPDDIERKRKRIQKEQLRKKKAERRAQAKHRKQASKQGKCAADGGVEPSEPVSGGPVPEPDQVETTRVITQDHQHPHVTQDTAADVAAPVSERDIPAKSESERAKNLPRTDDETSSQELQHTAAMRMANSVVSRLTDAQELPELSLHADDSDVHRVIGYEAVEAESRQPPQRYSTSTLSMVNTSAVQHESSIIDAKEEPRTRQSPPPTLPSEVREYDRETAAVTIQKVLKRKIIKGTKKTMRKAKSLIRHSSKVAVAEDSSAGLIETLPIKDQSIQHAAAAELVAASPILEDSSGVSRNRANANANAEGARTSPVIPRLQLPLPTTPVSPMQLTEPEKPKKKAHRKHKRRPSTSSSDSATSSSPSSASSSIDSDSSSDHRSHRRGCRRHRRSSRSKRRHRRRSPSSSRSRRDDRAKSGPSSRILQATPTAAAAATAGGHAHKDRERKRSSVSIAHHSFRSSSRSISQSSSTSSPFYSSSSSSSPSPSSRPRQRSRPILREYTASHHEHAMKIQAGVRGFLGRRHARQRQIELERELREEALKELQEEASVRIQANVKGFLQRRRHQKHHQHHHHHRHHHHGHSNPSNLVHPETPQSSESDAWPAELNREIEDDWEELNCVDPQSDDGALVTQARFLTRGSVRVFVGTWNLHAKKPPSEALRRWLPRNRYHIVAVGTEECLHSIARSVVFASKKPWEDQLKEVLGNEYVVVASHALTAIHNVVFVHESVVPWLHNVHSDAVATGLGNQLGNKGGVGIAFNVGRTSFAFVNCHFDAHQHNVNKRNANFHRINQELRLQATNEDTSPLRTATSSWKGSTRASLLGGARRSTRIADAFDHVFWYGDLNYRINGTRRMIDRLLLHQQHAVLRFNDQLLIEMTRGNVFAGFSEGPLHFRPTYKFDKHSDAYDSSAKQRIPSWTDRVLFKSNVDERSALQQLSYRSDMSCQISDHRPVAAVFEARVLLRDNVASTDAAPTRHSVPTARVAPEETNEVPVTTSDPAVVGGVARKSPETSSALAKEHQAMPTRSEVCVLQ